MVVMISIYINVDAITPYHTSNNLYIIAVMIALYYGSNDFHKLLWQ